MTKPKPTVLAAEIPQKAQTRIVRWLTQVVAGNTKAEGGMVLGIDGRLVTFHGRSGEATLKAIVEGKDVALYRWKRGLDLQLRTALAQEHLSQKCVVLTSDRSVIAALDSAHIQSDDEPDRTSHYAIALGRLTDAEVSRTRNR